MTFIHTEVYDTNRDYTLAPTNTNMTNPPSTLASLTHIYYSYMLVITSFYNLVARL